MLDLETEKNLIIKAQDGNLDAFEELLFTYEKPIFNYVYRLAPQKEESQDIAQETFIKFYKNLKKFDPAKSLKTWLYTIATRTAYDHLRKKHHQMEWLIIDENETEIETITEDDAYNILETQQDLEKALGQIKPIYRTVLHLVYFQGFTQEEASQILNRPLNTIKTLARRAKIALRQKLTNE